MKIWRIRNACWIHAANTHSEQTYVKRIAFPEKKCLHERAGTLRYNHIACIFLT
jgi:hypothetical protein